MVQFNPSGFIDLAEIYNLNLESKPVVSNLKLDATKISQCV